MPQIVDGQLDDSKTRKFSAKALARIKHIETMINDMLVFAHGGQFHTSDFAVDDLLDELQDQVAPHMQQQHAEIDIRRLPGTVLLNGNKDALLGALANLCMNAIDASKGQLTIEIALALTDKGMLSLTIGDNGKGMDEQTLQHLFDPFFTTKIDGTGLGLAVVKSVIESHQGTIEARSELGAGSCFTILLPSLQASRTQLSRHTNEEINND